MHIYKIDQTDHELVHVVARSPNEAADLFVTWRAAHDDAPSEFTVKCLRIDTINPQQQVQVRSAIAAGLVGICHFDQEVGWTFSPPMWVPLGPDGNLGAGIEGGRSVMLIYQFRDPTPIEAIVIAADQDAATAIFQMHLRAHGGDPDTLLWRELQLHHLEDEAAEAVREALALNREGLVICDAENLWAFVTPLGDCTKTK